MVLRKHPLCVSSTVFRARAPRAPQQRTSAAAGAGHVTDTCPSSLAVASSRERLGGLLDVQHVSSKDAFNASVGERYETIPSLERRHRHVEENSGKWWRTSCTSCMGLGSILSKVTRRRLQVSLQGNHQYSNPISRSNAISLRHIHPPVGFLGPTVLRTTLIALSLTPPFYLPFRRHGSVELVSSSSSAPRQSSSRLVQMSAPTAKRKLRHFVFSSFLFTCLLSKWSSFLRTPPLLHASSALLTHQAQHRPPLHPRHAILLFLLPFLFWSKNVHEFLPRFGSRWSAENRISVRLIKLHRLRRSLAHHRHAIPPAHRNPLACARVLDA